MNRSDFAEGKVYLHVDNGTRLNGGKRFFRFKGEALEIHMTVSGGWSTGHGWTINSIYKHSWGTGATEEFVHPNTTYITPDDFFLQQLGEMGKL